MNWQTLLASAGLVALLCGESTEALIAVGSCPTPPAWPVASTVIAGRYIERERYPNILLPNTGCSDIRYTLTSTTTLNVQTTPSGLIGVPQIGILVRDPSTMGKYTYTQLGSVVPRDYRILIWFQGHMAVWSCQDFGLFNKRELAILAPDPIPPNSNNVVNQIRFYLNTLGFTVSSSFVACP